MKYGPTATGSAGIYAYSGCDIEIGKSEGTYNKTDPTIGSTLGYGIQLSSGSYLYWESGRIGSSKGSSYAINSTNNVTILTGYSITSSGNYKYLTK